MISIPGNSPSRCAAITCSSGTKRSPSGITTKRGSSGGTFTRANRCSPVSGSRTTTARFSDRFEMYGKGCAGSTASGVRTGKTFASNTSTRYSRSSSSSSSHLENAMPTSSSAGAISLVNSSAWRVTSSSMRALIARSCWSGSIPSGVRVRIPAATCSWSPETRTWTNSSRFEPKMARNLARSRRGRCVSSASASTRALKSSQESSRFSSRCSSGASAAVSTDASYRRHRGRDPGGIGAEPARDPPGEERTAWARIRGGLPDLVAGGRGRRCVDPTDPTLGTPDGEWGLEPANGG